MVFTVVACAFTFISWQAYCNLALWLAVKPGSERYQRSNLHRSMCQSAWDFFSALFWTQPPSRSDDFEIPRLAAPATLPLRFSLAASTTCQRARCCALALFFGLFTGLGTYVPTDRSPFERGRGRPHVLLLDLDQSIWRGLTRFLEIRGGVFALGQAYGMHGWGGRRQQA